VHGFRCAIFLLITVLSSCASTKPSAQISASSKNAHAPLPSNVSDVTKIHVAQAARCESWTSSIQQRATEADSAFQGEVVSVEQVLPDSKEDRALYGYIQTLRFRVLSTWKGNFRPGDLVSTVVQVTEVCGARGCILPFKTGDVTIVISPPRTVADHFNGGGESCGGGTLPKGILSVLALMPQG
jgi:hypothetical protein